MNKRVPKEMQKYVIVWTKKTKEFQEQKFQYFKTQKAAKEWAKGKEGKKQLFRIDYDFYAEL